MAETRKTHFSPAFPLPPALAPALRWSPRCVTCFQKSLHLPAGAASPQQPGHPSLRLPRHQTPMTSKERRCGSSVQALLATGQTPSLPEGWDPPTGCFYSRAGHAAGTGRLREQVPQGNSSAPVIALRLLVCGTTSCLLSERGACPPIKGKVKEKIQRPSSLEEVFSMFPRPLPVAPELYGCTVLCTLRGVRETPHAA